MQRFLRAWVFSSLSQEPISRNGDITKREFVAIVTSAAIAVIFCPESLRPFRDVGIVLFLAWCAHILHDVWESIPTWLKIIVNYPSAGNENPHDRDGWTMERSTRQLKELVSRIRAAAVGLWHKIHTALLEALQKAIELLKSPQGEGENPHLAPQPTKWYGFLIAQPPVHVYGPISDHLPRRAVTPEAIPWESYSTAGIPNMIRSLNFRIHLAFCLIEKTVWESQSLTLSQKMMTGSYWDIRGQNIRNKCATWSEFGVREIIGIECLGLADAGDDPVNKCWDYFALLREDWAYMNIWWNDVDFALLLGYLIVGQGAATKCKTILEVFCHLREEEVVRPRNEGCVKGRVVSFGVGAVSFMATFATGGFLAPVTVPLFLTSCGTVMGCGIAESEISRGVMVKRLRRLDAFNDLVGRFPQLNALF